MKSMNLIAAAAVGLTMATTTAMAQDATTMDADGDGAYSYDELMAAFPDLSEETFLSADANADGLIDEEELAMARDAGILPAAD